MNEPLKNIPQAVQREITSLIYSGQKVARIELEPEERGLTIGVPFPVFVEIETDPVGYGNTRKRRHPGGLGNQNQPVLMIMN